MYVHVVTISFFKYYINNINYHTYCFHYVFISNNPFIVIYHILFLHVF